jgi:hypothetical protein
MQRWFKSPKPLNVCTMEGYWKLNRDLIVSTLNYDPRKINSDYAAYLTIHGDHAEIRDNFFILLYRELIELYRAEDNETKLLHVIDLYYGFGDDMKRSMLTRECEKAVDQLLYDNYGLTADNVPAPSKRQFVNIRA